MSLSFEILSADTSGGRLGRLTTPHGEVLTPMFMPVGTRASVKGMPPFLLEEAGATIVLSNTFHLGLRPGSGLIRDLGGVHRFMGWEGPILTDSGGFQVFSLKGLRRVSEEGIAFRSPVDGAEIFLSPERSVEIQEELGVDIAMALDELVPGDAPRAMMEAAMERTTRWARRCKAANSAEDTALFGIVQGGMEEDLRARSAADLNSLDLQGYAAGGFSVGEKKETFRRMAAFTGLPLAAGEAPVPHGRGYSPRFGGSRRVGLRPVRLRPAHPQRPQRKPLHLPRHRDHQERRAHPGRVAAGRPAARAGAAATSRAPTSTTSTAPTTPRASS